MSDITHPQETSRLPVDAKDVLADEQKTPPGGARRDRTDDLLLAKQALSQLSYGPNKWWVWEESNFRPHPYQGCALTN